MIFEDKFQHIDDCYDNSKGLDLQKPLLSENGNYIDDSNIPEGLLSDNSFLNNQKYNKNQEVSKRYNDIIFLFLFLFHLFMITVIAISYGLYSLQHYNPAQIIVNGNDNSYSFTEKYNVSFKIFWGLCIVLLSSVLLSFSWIYFFAKFASYLISSIMVFIILFTIILAAIIINSGLYIVGIILLALSLIIVLICLFLRPRIDFAAVNLKVSCEAILNCPIIIINSLFVQCLQILFILLWSLAVFGYATNSDDNLIYSSSNSRWYNIDQCTTYEYSKVFQLNNEISLTCGANSNNICQSCVCDGSLVFNNKACFTMKLYPYVYTALLFSLFWTSSVLSNVIHSSTASIVSKWWGNNNYYNINELVNCDVNTELKDTLTKSLGSICFGSLLVAIIRIARTILNLVTQNIKKLKLSSALYYFQKYLISLLSFLLSLLDRVMTYFNRYAFCYVGIYGYDFLKSSKCAIGLFSQKGWSVLLNDDIIDFVLYLSNLLVGSLCMLVGLVYCRLTDLTSLSCTLFLLLSFYIGFLMSMISTSVISSSVSTVYICFGESPDVFESVHPELFNELSNSWNAIFSPSSSSFVDKSNNNSNNSNINNNRIIRGTYFSSTPQNQSPSGNSSSSPYGNKTNKYFSFLYSDNNNNNHNNDNNNSNSNNNVNNPIQKIFSNIYGSISNHMSGYSRIAQEDEVQDNMNI